jgi:hypothetical protein
VTKATRLAAKAQFNHWESVRQKKARRLVDALLSGPSRENQYPSPKDGRFFEISRLDEVRCLSPAVSPARAPFRSAKRTANCCATRLRSDRTATRNDLPTDPRSVRRAIGTNVKADESQVSRIICGHRAEGILTFENFSHWPSAPRYPIASAHFLNGARGHVPFAPASEVLSTQQVSVGQTNRVKTPET